MNFEELMQSMSDQYPHPYTESYKMGFKAASDKMSHAIIEALGKDALRQVLEHVKSTGGFGSEQ